MLEHNSLFDFLKDINSLFSLPEQGKKLVNFVAEDTGCKHVALLFLDADKEYFHVLSTFSDSVPNPFRNLKLSRHDPFVRHLDKTRKAMTSESISALPETKRPRFENSNDKVRVISPIVSRNRLIGILVLGEKFKGKYSGKDCEFLENVAGLAAGSMEKEFIRGQLNKVKKELSVINRSSAIMASSLDVQMVFGSFIRELKKIAKIDWATINVIGDGYLYFLAQFPEVDSPWKSRDRIPSAGTASEWVAEHNRAIVDRDITKKPRFSNASDHLAQGIRSIAYLPLTSHGRTFGSLTFASRHPNAYSRRQVTMLKELASQIMMPIEHSQLYAEVEEEARIDKLTGLFNRRSFDEVMNSEINRYSRYGGVFSLIITDIDQLASINDNYGHLAGDEALRQIGSVVRRAVRASDQAFRYGGDEFVIFLPNTSIDAAYMVAERIRKQVASLADSLTTQVTASLGLASWPDDGTDSYAVISAADTALYEAKRNGGNQIRSPQART